MSASQLRAKAGIPHNSKSEPQIFHYMWDKMFYSLFCTDWSTKQGQDDSTLLIIGAVVFVLALGLFAYFSVSD